MTPAELAEHRERIQGLLNKANFVWSSVFTPERLQEAGKPLSLSAVKSGLYQPVVFSIVKQRGFSTGLSETFPPCRCTSQWSLCCGGQHRSGPDRQPVSSQLPCHTIVCEHSVTSDHIV